MPLTTYQFENPSEFNEQGKPSPLISMVKTEPHHEVTMTTHPAVW